MIKLFVGLGNPGPDYEATRHNAGFWWIDALARELKATLVPERSYHGLVARTTVHGQSVWLLQPQTFMNLSGKSVASLARFFKIQPEEILVERGPTHAEWFALSLREGKPSKENGLEGHLAAGAGHLANMSYRRGKKLKWNWKTDQVTEA